MADIAVMGYGIVGAGVVGVIEKNAEGRGVRSCPLHTERVSKWVKEL